MILCTRSMSYQMSCGQDQKYHWNNEPSFLIRVPLFVVLVYFIENCMQIWMERAGDSKHAATNANRLSNLMFDEANFREMRFKHILPHVLEGDRNVLPQSLLTCLSKYMTNAWNLSGGVVRHTRTAPPPHHIRDWYLHDSRVYFHSEGFSTWIIIHNTIQMYIVLFI